MPVIPDWIPAAALVRPANPESMPPMPLVISAIVESIEAILAVMVLSVSSMVARLESMVVIEAVISAWAWTSLARPVFKPSMPVCTPASMSATVFGVSLSNIRVATVFVRATIVVTSAVLRSSTRSGSKVPLPLVLILIVCLAVRSGRVTSLSWSA